jgi:uridylate kinase
MQPKFKRVLIKLSGEALSGDSNKIIDPKVINRIAQEILELTRRKVQVAIVIGGGNLFRGESLSALGINRLTGDYMGMLATIMNSLALRDAMESSGHPTRIMSAISMLGVVDSFDRRKALRHLEKGDIVIFAGGTGNPLVTTDTAASLRAIEVEAELLLKATKVDGVFDKDPSLQIDAKIYSEISYKEALSKELGVMDLGAFCQCRDHKMPIAVFNIKKPGALLRIILGEQEGTLVR